MKKARIKDGFAVCPRCGKRLCRIMYGARAYGIELWCNRCHESISLEILGDK